MLRNDAHKIAEAINERVESDAADAGKAVTATVEASETRPDTVPIGAGRPTFIQFQIQISDGTRLANLDLHQAELLLDTLEPGCVADHVFDAIRGQDVPIADTRQQP
jgi:hypothetical protein